MKLKLNQLIEVEWDDIVSYAVWIDEKEARKRNETKCKTVGYFLNQDKKVLRLSCTIQLCDRPERDLNVIPIGCITKIRRLK